MKYSVNLENLTSEEVAVTALKELQTRIKDENIIPTKVTRDDNKIVVDLNNDTHMDIIIDLSSLDKDTVIAAGETGNEKMILEKSLMRFDALGKSISMYLDKMVVIKEIVGDNNIDYPNKQEIGDAIVSLATDIASDSVAKILGM